MKNFSMLIPVLLFLFMSYLPASAAEAAGDGQRIKFTKHFKQTFFAITEKAEFSIEVLPDEKEYKIGSNLVGIVVHNRNDQDVEGADLIVTAGGDEPLAVREKGGGLYTLSNLDLKREGEWKLVITVRKKGVVDRASFAFPATAGKYLPPGSYDAGGTK